MSIVIFSNTYNDFLSRHSNRINRGLSCRPLRFILWFVCFRKPNWNGWHLWTGMFLTDRTRHTLVFVRLFHCQNGVIDGPLVSVPYPAPPFLRRVAALLSTSHSAALSPSLAASRRMSTPSLYRSLPHAPTSALSRLYGKLQVAMSPWHWISWRCRKVVLFPFSLSVYLSVDYIFFFFDLRYIPSLNLFLTLSQLVKFVSSWF